MPKLPNLTHPTFPAGRVCSRCHRPLSIYNPGPDCHQHTRPTVPDGYHHFERERLGDAITTLLERD